MSKIQLILLGHFECLLSSGQRISLSMRKAEVLLAYLALTPGLRHPRERLINLLWSDRSDEQARNSLRQCLSAIKKSLGSAADLILLVDRTTVSLKPELIDVDVHEFERLALESDYESLATATRLYQGEFLEGISIRDAACQEWLDSERSRFKRQFIEILSNLAETQLISHDYNHAIRSAERLVEQDPLGESGWRLLMRSYAESGDRSHALQAFKRCQQNLRDELDVEPEVITIELRDQIAAGESRPSAKPVSAAKPDTIPDAPGTAASASTDHSIAVLPFDNLSGDPEQEYFTDGITDSIILHLSLFPGLNVKSRNSSFAFKQQIKSLGEISQELEVDYLVEGSIRKSVDRIRITVQLIEAASGNQVWGKRYDAEIDNLFDLEEELSRSIAATVTGQIESDLQRIAVAKGAAGQESYDLLLSGVYHAIRFNRQDSLIGIDKLNQCLAQDPDNVRAHVHLYSCHSMNYLERWVKDYEASFKLAAEHMHKALALDPESALVQAYYAEYLIFNGQLDEAVKHLNKALEINPNDPNALTIMALYLELQGNFDAALEMAERSYRLDPYHPWLEWELAVSRYFCGQYEATLETIENARTSPSFTRIFSVAANIKLGRTDAARQELLAFLRECRENMLSMPTTLDEWTRYLRENYLFKDTRDNKDIVECLLAAGLEDEIEPRRRSIENETHSIAVLPFDNLSGDPAQEYFSDGITESIILNLSLFPGLNVKSRNTSFAFKQQIKSPGEISRELEVDYLVEGSIRKTDERVRVTVQLVEAQSANQVWGKRYDAEIENLFDLEEELSRTIATTVTGQIEFDLQRIAIAKGAAHQKAYDLLLQGIYHSKLSTPQDCAIAIEKLNQCLALDASNALAHATLYGCHEMNWIDRWVSDFEASRKLCKIHASKALELNPDLGQVQVAYAEYLIFSRDYEEAEAHLEKALGINPNDSEAIAALALNLSSLGKFEAALEQARLAIRLDPYHTWVRWILTEAQFFCGQYEEALTTIAETGNPPGFLQIYKIATNIRLNRMDVAQETLKIFLQNCRNSMLSMPRNIDEWLAYSRDNSPFADPAINREIIDYLVQAGLEDELNSQQAQTDPGQQPSILVLPFNNMSGDPEQAYFSNGITESIILTLSSSWGLTVKSRHTSFAYQDSTQSIREIGDELDVPYIVEGSIRKHQDQVRITVQLGESSTGNQIWGKRYDKHLDELFEVEEDLVRSIAAAISGRIGREVRIIASKKPASDMKSFDYLMRGWYYYEQHNPEALAKSIECHKKCIEIDPKNVDAHAFIAGVSEDLLYENWCEDREQTRSEIEHYIQKALALDQNNAYTHAIMGDFVSFTGDYDKGLYHANRAIELDPTLPDGYTVKAINLVASGDIDAAVELADFGMQLDQFHNYTGWGAGDVYRCAGDYKKAIEAYRTVANMPPSLQAQVAACLVGLGQLDNAKAEMDEYLHKARELMPRVPASKNAWHSLWSENVNYQRDKDFDAFFEQLLQAGLCDDLDEATDRVPSIAVLPFENMSGDPEQEHFSDGITTDIIATLSRFEHMRTISRYSVLQYKNQHASIPDIAQQQNVRYILEGSVRKSGNSIRVSAELIDSQDEKICWSEHYDRDLDDLFAVQDEITKNIALAMKVQLDDGDMAVHRSTGTTNIKAWQLTLAAIDLQDTYIRENILEARRMAQQAIDLDPDYPYAWVALGWTHWQEVYSGFSNSPEDSLVEAETAQQKALDLVPLYSEAWTLGGLIHLMRHKPTQALEYCRKAVKLEPGNAEIQALMAFCLIYVGDYENARQHEKTMLKLCPVLPNWYYLLGGEIAQIQGNYESAAHRFQQGIDVEPDSPLCRFYLIDVMMEQGNETRAGELADEIKALDKQVKGRGMVRTLSQDKNLRERFRANLEKFDLY